MKHRALVALGCLVSMLSTGAQSYELSDSFRINGFGTIGVSTNDSDRLQFRQSPEQTTGVGKAEFNFAVNDVAGLQGRYQLSETLSITAQGLVHYMGADAWDGDLDWAYLTYEAPLGISARVGKFRFPNFRSSELAYVGYARTYARPPLVFYGVGGYENVLGAQIEYERCVGPLDLGLQATFGRSRNDSPIRGDGVHDELESDDIKILSLRLEDSRAWVQVAYTELTTELTTIGVRPTPVDRGSAGVRMWSAEWQVRLGDFVHEGGYGKGLVDRVQPDEKVFYASIARPFGEFTPYLLYSYKRFSDVPGPQLPGPRTGMPRGGADRSSITDEIYSFGVRYDFRPGLALKLQFDHVEVGAGTNRLSLNQTGEEGSHNAVSLLLDWMF